MEQIRGDQIKDMLATIAGKMEENAELLCSMDRQMGDGDLGITMSKGWRAAANAAGKMTETDIGRILMKSGMEMSSVVPSTMGTLMSSGLMGSGKRLLGQANITADNIAEYLLGFAEGIQKRGKCNPGDRTVLDAIYPAALASKDSVETTLELRMKIAVEAGREGVEATKQMTPRFGKAAVFAAKAGEMVDQGALAGSLMLEGLYEYIMSDI